MIKKYNQYIKESLIDKLEGPSIQDVIDSIKKNPNVNLWGYYVNNDFDTLKYLIEHGANVDYMDGVLLRDAIGDKGFKRQPNTEFVKYLIEHGSNVKLYNSEALRFACSDYDEDKWDNMEIIKMLLDAGSDVHALGDYCMMFAKGHNQPKLINLLNKYMYPKISKKIDRFKKFMGIKESLLDKLEGPSEEEIQKNIMSLYPINRLVKSCQIGYIDGVKSALEDGVYIHHNGDFPIRTAARNGYYNIVKLLLDESQNHSGKFTTGLEDAWKIASDDTIKDLIMSYNYLDKQIMKIKYPEFRKYNESLLNHLTGPSEQEIIDTLENDPEIKDVTDMFIKCCMVGYLNGVKKAVQNGANYLEAYGNYNSGRRIDDSFIDACENNHLDVAEYLIKLGANVQYDNSQALVTAIGENQYEIVKLILDNGGDITSVRRNVDLIKNAILWCNVNIVKLLLDTIKVNNYEDYSKRHDKIMEYKKFAEKRHNTVNDNDNIIKLLEEYEKQSLYTTTDKLSGKKSYKVE